MSKADRHFIEKVLIAKRDGDGLQLAALLDLAGSDPLRVRATLRALSRTPGCDVAFEQAMRALSRAPTIDVQHEVAKRLHGYALDHELKTPPWVFELAMSMQSSDDKVLRAFARGALLHSGDPEHLRPLVQCGDWFVRHKAQSRLKTLKAPLDG